VKLKAFILAVVDVHRSAIAPWVEISRDPSGPDFERLYADGKAVSFTCKAPELPASVLWMSDSFAVQTPRS
jgi:hypothetical protein